MNGLFEALAAAAEQKPPPVPSIQAKRLGELFQRYREPCPFKPGDLVTPIEGRNIKGAGQPAIVVEVLAEPR